MIISHILLFKYHQICFINRMSPIICSKNATKEKLEIMQKKKCRKCNEINHVPIYLRFISLFHTGGHITISTLSCKDCQTQFYNLQCQFYNYIFVYSLCIHKTQFQKSNKFLVLTKRTQATGDSFEKSARIYCCHPNRNIVPLNDQPPKITKINQLIMLSANNSI